MNKKILSVMVSLILLCAAVIALSTTVPHVHAADPSGKCGENLSWKLEANGTLTVSGEGDMTDYAADGEPASPFTALGGEVKAVTVGPGVTSVGDNAFYECYNVADVTLPEGLTRIGESAFYFCRELSSLTLPGSVTEIGRRAFRSCLALETVSLPDGLTHVGEKAFFDTAWYNAQPDGPVYLGTVLLAYKGEMPRKTEIAVAEGTLLIADSAFWTCGRMVSLTLPEGLLYIGEDAFYECDGFTELRFPAGLLTIGERAFYCCGLETVSLPKSLTAIGKAAFKGSDSLKNVFVPAAVTEIGPEAFPAGTELVGYEGTFAQQYATQMGLKFTVRADPDAPETTTAPEGERVKLQRRKQTGTVVACVAAGVIGVAAVIGLIVLRKKPEDDLPGEE